MLTTRGRYIDARPGCTPPVWTDEVRLFSPHAPSGLSACLRRPYVGIVRAGIPRARGAAQIAGSGGRNCAGGALGNGEASSDDGARARPARRRDDREVISKFSLCTQLYCTVRRYGTNRSRTRQCTVRSYGNCFSCGGVIHNINHVKEDRILRRGPITGVCWKICATSITIGESIAWRHCPTQEKL
jgi:hypothetical protein